MTSPEAKELSNIEAELHHIHRDIVQLTNGISDIAGMIEEARGIKEGEEE